MSTEKQPPLKRHPALQPLSRQHHYGLQLCWKIRAGLAKDVDTRRIKAYCDWFFEAFLRPHFDLEETHIFPLLGDRKSHPMVKRAMQEHGRLRRLFGKQEDLPRQLSLIEEQLTAHIRYEERILFAEVQRKTPPAVLEGIERLHMEHSFEETWEDCFWEYTPQNSPNKDTSKE